MECYALKKSFACLKNSEGIIELGDTYEVEKVMVVI